MKAQMRFLAPALFALVAGCAGAAEGLVVVGGKPFSQETLNDDANKKGQEKVLAALAQKPPALGADAVVAVTGTTELTGVDLQSGKTWSYKHPLDRRPEIAGIFVVGQGGGEIFVLDAKSGAEKFKTNKPKGKLIGAGSDGTVIALTTKTPEGSALYVLGTDGTMKFDKTTEMPLADPGVAAGIVFVPWKNLYVTTFEAASGSQLATFITDTETTRVRAIGGALFAGQGRLVRFDADLLKAKQGGSQLAMPPKDLPNVTRRDIYVGVEHEDRLQSDAIDSTALAGRPLAKGPAGWEGGKLYGAYYPFVMGLDEKTAKLAWVHSGKDDFVAMEAAKDGVVAVDKAGNVKLLAGANGAVVKTFNLGKPVLSADVFADSLTIGTGTAPALPQQIKDATTLGDNRLSTAQVWFLDQATQVADEEVTQVLLEVADTERAAPPIKEAARKAIAARTNGANAMITLLGRHADFLKGTRTPPVGPMAKALAAMKEKKAAGPLLAQLLDPALPGIDLLDTAEGVASLAEKEHLPQLQRFINMYRGSSSGNMKLSDALAAIAGAIIRLDGDKGREWVIATIKDPLTDADVRSTIQKLLDSTAPKKKDEPKTEEPAPEDKGKKKKKKEDDGPEPPGYKKAKEKEKLEADKKAKEKAEKEAKKKKPEEKKEGSPPEEKKPEEKKE
ncbi:MAG: hypothetical protein ACXWP4_03345 [Polyangiales bacterium]